MASKEFSIEPRRVAQVSTPFRRIVSPTLPAKESLPVLQMLRDNEPFSMRGQPPVVWDRAEGFQVYDANGNMWLDWSSGVLVTNAGHGRKEIRDAVIAEASRPLLHTYCFPSESRALLAKKLVDIAPGPLTRAFILTTGAETTECAIKLAKTWGIHHGGPGKKYIVTFDESFHGRTMGAQLAGGIPALKEWIGDLDPSFIQMPHPGSNVVRDKRFELFERLLGEQGIAPDSVAGVMTETYQGGNCGFMPDEYARALRSWCDRHNVVLIFDEVQACFGRTGKMWGFEHHGIVPDIMCLGKGISSSLPIAAVVGREEIMNMYGPGSMTSTHSGYPLGAAAALASIELIERENLVENARVMGEHLLKGLESIRSRHAVHFDLQGRGLVYAFMALKNRGTMEPDADLAFDIILRCFEAGLLMFSPVGRGGGCVKIAPPLCITAEAIDEGLAVFGKVVDEAVTAAG